MPSSAAPFPVVPCDEAFPVTGEPWTDGIIGDTWWTLLTFGGRTPTLCDSMSPTVAPPAAFAAPSTDAPRPVQEAPW